MNIAKILECCPNGTELYSPVYGKVTLEEIINNEQYPIKVITDDGYIRFYTKEGKLFDNRPNGECVLFPSKDQRDWSKFVVPNKHQFKPFDKVLVRDRDSDMWNPAFFALLREDSDEKFGVIDIGVPAFYRQCIPYEGNEHLLGTTNKTE